MRDFQTLFKGREDAHGEYDSLSGRDATDRGKLVSKAHSVRTPVTPKLWKDHLAGKSRLGIIPVRSDARCGWFCIDLDFYKIGNKTLEETGGYEKIAKVIRDLGLKLVVTRSKSGGAHMWCFLEEPMKAADAHKAAKDLLKKMALPGVLGINGEELLKHVDLFPKDFSPDNIGSWVNLPYFGDKCHGIGEDGKSDLALPDFIKLANANLCHPDDLRFKVKEAAKTVSDPHKGRPPCIDFMIENGVPEGHRNNAVTQFAIFAFRAFPDTYEEETRNFNAEHCDPPMRPDEVTPIIKSVSTGKYQYMCNAMQDIFCDKAACRKREFGIGKQVVTDDDLGIESIEKIDGEKPVYLVKMVGNERTFPVDLDELFTYMLFRRKVMGAVNRMIPSLKQAEWEDILSDKLEMMTITQAAVDTQMRDRVIKQFQNWCGQGIVTDSLDAAITANAPFYNGNSIIFSGDALLNQLDRQLKVSRDQAYVYMRGWGTMETVEKVKGKNVTLWKWVQNGPLWFEPNKGKQK